MFDRYLFIRALKRAKTLVKRHITNQNRYVASLRFLRVLRRKCVVCHVLIVDFVLEIEEKFMNYQIKVHSSCHKLSREPTLQPKSQ